MRAAALALGLAALASPAAAQRGDPLRGLDAYVTQAMKDWEVPGLALAVVKDDSVVFMRGFGVRTLGTGEAVDTHTSFSAASTTKAFTAAALGMLVDEGRVRWDDPVVRHLPSFRTADPHLTGEITVRDLLTHRTGLPTEDFLWYASPNSSADILHRLRWVRPFAPVRTQYRYNNNAYLLAGLVVEAASGTSWHDFVRTRILEPLGMRETLTGYRGLDRRGNTATPHLEVNDTIRPIAYRDFDNIAPAGSMNTSVHDMVRWIRFHLDSARVGGRRLLSDSVHRELLTPQFIIPAQAYYPAARLAKPNFRAYGLGWFMQDYRGRKLAMHTGSIDGMTALVALVPEERLGFVVFANLDHAELRHALMYRVVDAYTGAPPRDWSTELRALYHPPGREEAQRREREQMEAARPADTRPSLPLEAYAGRYTDPDSLFGTFTIRIEDGKLMAAFSPLFTGTLEHWAYDTFRARWADPSLGTSFLAFTISPTGRAMRVEVQDVGGFERAPDPEGEGDP
ncbi:MAG TPA: serine hydrolase [Longimicrobium sp.]|nr:serine hydrolase [Longimicrobium sp.]